MSTLKDFEDAPVGATANGGKWVKYRPTNPDWPEWVKADWATAPNSNLAFEGIALDPLPGTPTTAREALDLAWELAHPVKRGDALPSNTDYLMSWRGERPATMRSTYERVASETDERAIRTLDPLPEPEPDWLGAPAVLARVKGWPSCADPQVFSRSIMGDGQWVLDTKCYHLSELTDVTPLYPKGQDK